MVNPPITTSRLTLEPLTIDHAAEMAKVLASESLYEFTGGEPPTIDSLRERYRSQIAGPSGPGEIWMNWIIRISADKRAAGYFQADIIGDEAELAWVVAPEHQGSGIASEGALATKDWLSSQGVKTFTACIHTAHGASQAVARNIGLTFTGQHDDEGEQVWST